MANKHFDILLEKYRIALQRLEWALGQIDKNTYEVIKEKNSNNSNDTKLDELSNEINSLLKELEHKDTLLNSINLKKQVEMATSIEEDTRTKSTAVSFGIAFPENPSIGQMFLRVDTLPSKLFKWNGTKWITVDKKQNSSYTTDKKIIEHLINKLKLGELDWEDLTEQEQESIKPYLVKEAYLGR